MACDEAFEAGCDAYESYKWSLKGDSSCPYKPETPEYEAWQHGWDCQKGH